MHKYLMPFSATRKSCEYVNNFEKYLNCVEYIYDGYLYACNVNILWTYAWKPSILQPQFLLSRHVILNNLQIL
jgi:hypothetical protein